jgi:hypothetical protein
MLIEPVSSGEEISRSQIQFTSSEKFLEAHTIDQNTLRRPRVISRKEILRDVPSWTQTMAGTTMVLCLVMTCGSASGEGGSKKTNYTGTFSSLEYSREGGDLLGTEIKIVATKKGYQGALQIAEGGPSNLMLVQVAIDNDNVRFEIPNDPNYRPYAGWKFEGKIDDKSLKGNFSIGAKKADSETLTRKCSYWDK